LITIGYQSKILRHNNQSDSEIDLVSSGLENIQDQALETETVHVRTKIETKIAKIGLDPGVEDYYIPANLHTAQ